MKITPNYELIVSEEINQCEISLEEQEIIMNSKWFIDWMKEYNLFN